MTTPGASDWPPRWELSAPESHVLEHRGGANNDVPFRLAVEELVARRVLAAHPVKGGLWETPVTYAFTDGPRIDAPAPPVLAPAVDAYRAARQRRRKSLRDGSAIVAVPLRDLLKAGDKQLGGTGRYLDRHVAPALIERGLLQPAGRRSLGARPNFDWTDAGRESERVLQAWLTLGRDNLGRWAAEDQKRGAELVAGAGSALLLLDGHRLALADLGKRLQGTTPVAADGVWLDSSSGLDLSCIADLASFDSGIGGLGGIGDFGGIGDASGGGGGGGGDGGGGG